MTVKMITTVIVMQIISHASRRHRGLELELRIRHVSALLVVCPSVSRCLCMYVYTRSILAPTYSVWTMNVV